MKYSKIFITAFIAIVSGFTFVSCDKDDEETTNDKYASDEYARNLKFDGAIAGEYLGKYIIQTLDKGDNIVKADTIDNVSLYVEGNGMNELVFRNFPISELTTMISKDPTSYLGFNVKSVSNHDLCSPYTKEYEQKDSMMIMHHKPTSISFTAKGLVGNFDYHLYYCFSDNDTAYNVPLKAIYGNHALGNCNIKLRLEKIIGDGRYLWERDSVGLHYIVEFQSRQIITKNKD
jgi:hypothetical protein